MNKTSRLAVFTAGAITALSFSYALGAPEREGQAERQQSPQAHQQAGQHQEQQYGIRELRESKGHIKATDLKGSEVRSQAGDELGKVQEYAVNLENGELAYLLVSEEENGEEWTPVPAQAVGIEEEDGEIRLTVNIDQQRWEQAPKIQEGEIAQLGEEQRGRQIYQFFGEDYEARQQELQFGARDRQREQHQQPGQQQHPGQEQEYGQQQQQQQRPGERVGQQQQQPGAGLGQLQQQQEGETKLAGKMMEAEIKNQQEEKIGEISDFILNIEEGRIDFVLIEAEEEDGTFAVAPQAFELEGEDKVRLNVRQQHFRQAQELRGEQIEQRSRHARMLGAQARQNPQVFRFEEEEDDGPLFGAPGRDGEDKENEKEKE